MSTYRLIKVLQGGQQLEITSSFESDSLVAAAVCLAKEHPDMDFAVVDGDGRYIWPESAAMS